MVGRKANNLVKTKKENKQPIIIVKDLPLTEKYYRITSVRFNKQKYSRSRKEKTDEYFIYWHNEEDLLSGLSELRNAYNYREYDIKDIKGTKTHRYKSTRFTAEGFKP